MREYLEIEESRHSPRVSLRFRVLSRCPGLTPPPVTARRQGKREGLMARDSKLTILNPRLIGGARSTGGEHGAMAIITNQDDDANKKIKSSDRRKRAAAAKRMKNAEPGGWKSLSVEDRQFLAEVFKTYDKDGTGTLGENQLAPLLKALAGGVEPTPEEVQEVMDTADNDKSGAVSIDELKDVIRVWYVMCKKKDKNRVASSCDGFKAPASGRARKVPV